MKTSLTLSAVLFALTLTPAAFANGAQEQTQQVVAADAPTDNTASGTPVADRKPAPATLSITRSALERLELDVREELIGSLRESAMQVLQFAAPALLEAAGVATVQVDVTAR